MSDLTSTAFTITMLRCLGVVAASITLLASSGCEGLEDGGTTHPCSPSYVDENEFGRIAAQQAVPGGAIAWGVYPKKKDYARYVARLYIDSRKLGGGKDQRYEPHGTVNASTVKAKAKAGSVFRIDGETYDADGVRYSFFLRCRLA